VSVGLSGLEEADGGGKVEVDPYLPIGKFSSMGDKDLGSKAASAEELRNPSRFIPLLSWSSSSGGGVGVRGGAGIGRLVAIAFCSERILRIHTLEAKKMRGSTKSYKVRLRRCKLRQAPLLPLAYSFVVLGAESFGFRSFGPFHRAEASLVRQHIFKPGPVSARFLRSFS